MDKKYLHGHTKLNNTWNFAHSSLCRILVHYLHEHSDVLEDWCVPTVGFDISIAIKTTLKWSFKSFVNTFF